MSARLHAQPECSLDKQYKIQRSHKFVFQFSRKNVFFLLIVIYFYPHVSEICVDITLQKEIISIKHVAL